MSLLSYKPNFWRIAQSPSSGSRGLSESPKCWSQISIPPGEHREKSKSRNILFKRVFIIKKRIYIALDLYGIRNITGSMLNRRIGN